MAPLDHVPHETQRMIDAATEACDAVHDYARAANGNNGRVIPAATTYDLLGNTKALLWHLGEVIEYLPRGLQASFTDPRITIYDRDPDTGQPRDPATQAEIAAEHLARVKHLLAEAAVETEAAQTALNSQGWNTTEPG